MEVKLNGSAENEVASRSFPYSNWGPTVAIVGLVLALVATAILVLPVQAIDNPSGGDLGTAASIVAQSIVAIAFVVTSFGVALSRGAGSVREAARRLGLRRFEPSGLLWMLAAYVAYIAFSAAYVAVFGSPDQEIDLGPVAAQIGLIVVAAPVSEEICFRGMLFGGLRERMPALAAGLLSGLIFAALHAPEGPGVVPPLAVFGLVLALLYERTGSIVPGILLHALNNSIVLLAQ